MIDAFRHRTRRVLAFLKFKYCHKTSKFWSAEISPSVVYSFATIRFGRPASFAVCSVIGPIQANNGLFGKSEGFSPFCSVTAIKFRTVDELVNVMTSTPERSAARPSGSGCAGNVLYTVI